MTAKSQRAMHVFTEENDLACRMVDEALTTFPAAFPCAMPAPPIQAAPATPLTTDNPAGLSLRDFSALH